MMPDDDFELGMLNKVGHANFCARCLNGLPATMAEADSSRVAVGFYCIGSLDIIGLLDTKVKAGEREAWREWIWEQQVRRPALERVRHPTAATTIGTNAGPDQKQYRYAEMCGEDQHVGGFRPGPFMHVDNEESDFQTMDAVAAEADPPHLIMTYTALLALAILRDDFTRLDRQGLINLLRAAQKSDGSFSAFPGQGEADIRMVYTAFAISAMLDDWSGVDIPRAIAFTKRCMSYEGGFGQAPGNEAQGGPTYCALATLALAPPAYHSEATLTVQERNRAERWLVQQQQPWRVFEVVQEYEDEDESDDDRLINRDEGRDNVRREVEIVEEGGGFAGRTEKTADACYSFWCGAALRILRSGAFDNNRSPRAGYASASSTNGRPEANETLERQEVEEEEEPGFVDRLTHARFLSRCQFRLGGLAKAPGAHPDPYHTYLALAAVALYPPYPPDPRRLPGSPEQSETGSRAKKDEGEEREVSEKERKERKSWRVARLDPLINATEETARWAREKISGKAKAQTQS